MRFYVVNSSANELIHCYTHTHTHTKTDTRITNKKRGKKGIQYGKQKRFDDDCIADLSKSIVNESLLKHTERISIRINYIITTPRIIIIIIIIMITTIIMIIITIITR